jgi:hypothetical protein
MPNLPTRKRRIWPIWFGAGFGLSLLIAGGLWWAWSQGLFSGHGSGRQALASPEAERLVVTARDRVEPSTAGRFAADVAPLGQDLEGTERAAGLVRVRATGEASNSLPNPREAAIEAALRRCVEAGGGVELSSLSLSQDFMLVHDWITTRSSGYVRRHRVLDERPNVAGVYQVRVEALVDSGPLKQEAELLKALIQRKGRPSLMVAATAEGQPMEAEAAAAVERSLMDKGLRLVDPQRWTAQQRAAIRSAQLAGDEAKAASVAAEAGCDYMVVVSVRGQHHEPREVYGVKLHGVAATGIVRLIETASGQVISSRSAQATVKSRSAADAVRQARAGVLKRATDRMLTDLAGHWLEDLDPRRGRWVRLFVSGQSMNHLSDLSRRLRRTPTINEVRLVRYEAQGRSELSLQTNASLANLAELIQRADSSLELVSAESGMIELR